MYLDDKAEWVYIYLNPDGNWVSGFKAWDNAVLFRKYENGDIVPDSFFK